MGTNNKQEAYWVDELGVKYTKDKTCLLQAPMGLKCYTVYHGTKIIGDNAFYISKIESIILPNGLTCIGNAAFCGCANLKEIKLPDTLTEIGEGAFCGCPFEYISIPNDITIIRQDTFYGCTSLKSINLPNNLHKIGKDAFKSCWSLNSVNIPQSIDCIEEGAFSFCKSLLSLELPSCVNTIGNGIIEGCTSLESIIVDPNNKIYKSEDSNCVIERKGNVVIAGCNKTKIPSSIEVIGHSAFKNCTNLIEIVIPQGVKTIEIDAFLGCI